MVIAPIAGISTPHILSVIYPLLVLAPVHSLYSRINHTPRQTHHSLVRGVAIWLKVLGTYLRAESTGLEW